MLERIKTAVFSVTQAPSRIPSLDGLRAISIALVLFAHTAGTANFPSFVYLRRNLGNFGVRVFFVISGYLITTLLLKELSARGRISLKLFYIRRVFRIFPAAYFYLAVATILLALRLVDLKWNDIVYGFTYTTNYDPERPWHTIHLWSLSVEEQFYMIWPATLAFLGRRRGMIAAGSVILIAPLLRMLFNEMDVLRWTVGTGFPTNADALASGCLLAGFRSTLHESTAYRRFLASPMIWALPVFSFAYAAGAFFSWNPFGQFGYTILHLGIVLLIDRTVTHSGDWFGRLLNTKPFVLVGVLSYSLYLWQQPFLNRLSEYWWCAFPINLVLAFLMAFVSYLAVEKPCLDLRKHFEPAPERRPAPAYAQRNIAAAQE